MSGNKNPTYICQQYFSTNNCPIGDNCILKHIGKDDGISSSSQLEKGRTFAVLPVIELRGSKSLPNSVQSNLAKPLNLSQYNTVERKNASNIHEVLPNLTKAQKKRNRRKAKAIMTGERKNGTQDNRTNEKNLCAKPKSECKDNCKSLHGDLCDLCSRPVLHPLNPQYRREHSQQCVKKHEEVVKEQLAIIRSMDRQCSICFEAVMKQKEDHRFAILPDCNHCFCLVCIKIWRKSAGFGKSIRKSCPECRVVSHFVCPNKYWVENKEDKAEVILKYKCTLATIDCKYFAKDERCPFGNKCFYKHCKKDGTPVDLGAPWRNTDRIRRLGQHEFMMDALYDMLNEDLDESDNSVRNDDFEFDFDRDPEDTDESNNVYDDYDSYSEYYDLNF